MRETERGGSEEIFGCWLEVVEAAITVVAVVFVVVVVEIVVAILYPFDHLYRDVGHPAREGVLPVSLPLVVCPFPTVLLAALAAITLVCLLGHSKVVPLGGGGLVDRVITTRATTETLVVGRRGFGEALLTKQEASVILLMESRHPNRKREAGGNSNLTMGLGKVSRTAGCRRFEQRQAQNLYLRVYQGNEYYFVVLYL